MPGLIRPPAASRHLLPFLCFHLLFRAEMAACAARGSLYGQASLAPRLTLEVRVQCELKVAPQVQAGNVINR
jgi:hypothetical protein